MKRLLLIGPWCGEFGWLIMRWQGRCRKFAVDNRERFDKVIVATLPGTEYLFKDFADEIITSKYDKNCECWMTRRMGDPRFTEREWDEIQHRHKGYKIEWYRPTKETTALSMEDQTFLKLGNPCKKDKYDLIIHARKCNKRRTGNRDWPIQKWVAVTEYFKSKLKMASIGSPKDAIWVAHTDKQLGVPLERLADIVCSSRLVIGPSSGPMHFASLCGTKHLVWTDARRWGGARGTNKHRYESSWNPLGTKCRVLSDCNWQPQVSVVIRNIKDMLGML